MNIFSQITENSWNREALQFIPITKFNFDLVDVDLKNSLNHGFKDLEQFFPSWKEFLGRSQGKYPKYQNYMAFLLVKPTEDQLEIIGVLAVQLITYAKLKEKNFAITKDISNYLYLSWIALDQKYQSRGRNAS